MSLVLAVLVVLGLLLGNEALWRFTKIHNELSRKFIHITVGSFVAFWPFFLSWTQIRLLSVAFLIGVALSKYLGIFLAIHSVRRATLGEVFFALAVGVTTFVTHDKWVYATAMLQMSLADGLAAVIGVQYGKGNRYMVLGGLKSVAGTATFIVVSAGLLLVFGQTAGHALSAGRLVGITLVTTALENVAVWGLDNLVVPLVVAMLLANL